jgi:hydroxymethylglutaryl-CoA lyase
VTDVGPRDGLQNEATPVPTDVKVAFVRALVAAGVRDVEVSSFVRPDRIPQLADAVEVFRRLGPAPAGVVWGALVPNERGRRRARGRRRKVSVSPRRPRRSTSAT